MNSSNLRGMQLRKEWLLAWLSLTLVSYIPYYANFRLNNGPNMSSVLACFLGQFGWLILFNDFMKEEGP